MNILTYVILFACILVPSLKISVADDSINLPQSMSDGETLVSKGGNFELGFFSTSDSQKRYVGIWLKKVPVQTIVWVANGVNPINGSSGILTLNTTGNLVLTQNGSLVWRTISRKLAQNPVAVLLDSGNLVIRNEGETNPEEYLWQSFDHPSNTLLPGMKVGWNLRTGLERKITSWKSPDDPSPGDISWSLKPYNYPEFYLMQGTKKLYRQGPWNGLFYSGIPDLQNNTIFGITFVHDNDEIFGRFTLANTSVLCINVINQTGRATNLVWVEGDRNWRIYMSLPKDFCDSYGIFGAYGKCMSTLTQVCQCSKGFSPKSALAWSSSDLSQGCVRNKPLSCKGEEKDGFVNFFFF